MRAAGPEDSVPQERSRRAGVFWYRMELRTCYGDFMKRFRAYKMVRSCGPVRCLSRRGREYVRFMQVQFGCAQSQKYSKKRQQQQPSSCPADLVLQREEDTDQL